VPEVASLAPADDDRFGLCLLSCGEDLGRRIPNCLYELRLDAETAERNARLTERTRLPTALCVGDRFQP
jgi:hypothetical protein